MVAVSDTPTLNSCPLPLSFTEYKITVFQEGGRYSSVSHHLISFRRRMPRIARIFAQLGKCEDSGDSRYVLLLRSLHTFQKRIINGAWVSWNLGHWWILRCDSYPGQVYGAAKMKTVFISQWWTSRFEIYRLLTHKFVSFLVVFHNKQGMGWLRAFLNQSQSK